MPNRNWISKTGKLASLAAVSAGAISLTAAKAEASIIDSGTLNTTIGFSSNAPPSASRQLDASHLFNSLAGGPAFAFKAYGFKDGGGDSTTFRRSVAGSGVGFELRDGLIDPVAAGNIFSGTAGNGFAVASRLWGSSSGGSGSAFTDKYFLFRFNNNGIKFGWIEASLSLTSSSNANAVDGPNLTVIQYAFDNTGAKIAAGDTGTPSVPEPSTLAETGIGALILGAAGLRRWRKAQKAA